MTTPREDLPGLAGLSSRRRFCEGLRLREGLRFREGHRFRKALSTCVSSLLEALLVCLPREVLLAMKQVTKRGLKELRSRDRVSTARSRSRTTESQHDQDQVLMLRKRSQLEDLKSRLHKLQMLKPKQASVPPNTDDAAVLPSPKEILTARLQKLMRNRSEIGAVPPEPEAEAGLTARLRKLQSYRPHQKLSK